jgi:uncharacterized repeat protein (TIGR03803 family)
MKAKSLQLVLRWAAVLTASLMMSTAHAANQYKVLHYFGNRPASNPMGSLVADSAGNLYGTTAASSKTNCYPSCGTVFKLTRGSGGTWKYSVLHRFNGSDGAAPEGSLILDSSGNLYGTTFSGGAQNLGTVFELSPVGNRWRETVLYYFSAYPDVSQPNGALTMDKAGNLYGNGSHSGVFGRGGVFELKRSGNAWHETVICSFSVSDLPEGDLAWDSKGNLYGVAAVGGLSHGTVFELKHSGGGWKETVLYAFTGGTDGATPMGGVVFDATGNLYGTTRDGGPSGCGGGQNGCGDVYQLTPSNGHWTHTVLHTFNNTDGAYPVGKLLIDSSGNLYGTTQGGGGQSEGVVFKLTQSGGNWTETVLHSFDFQHGDQPAGALIFDQQGIFYSTALGGGLDTGDGVVFSLTP